MKVKKLLKGRLLGRDGPGGWDGRIVSQKRVLARTRCCLQPEGNSIEGSGSAEHWGLWRQESLQPWVVSASAWNASPRFPSESCGLAGRGPALAELRWLVPKLTKGSAQATLPQEQVQHAATTSQGVQESASPTLYEVWGKAKHLSQSPLEMPESHTPVPNSGPDLLVSCYCTPCVKYLGPCHPWGRP